MKLFAFLFFISSNFYATFPSQSEVRFLFHKSATEKRSCIILLNTLNQYNENNSPLLAGYKACATMMLAKHSFNPAVKLSCFLKGRFLLEKCITADRQNIELRFLRYTIQKKAPFFLCYRSSLKEDELILSSSVLHLKDPGLKKLIIDFFESEGELNKLK